MPGVATCLDFTKSHIAVAFSTGIIRLLGKDTGIQYCDIRAHATAVTAMTFNSQAQLLVTVSEDSYLRIWSFHEFEGEQLASYSFQNILGLFS